MLVVPMIPTAEPAKVSPARASDVFISRFYSKTLHNGEMAGFSIGGVTVANRLVLAPMEDVTALPMRLIAKRVANPGLLYTEFVSAQAAHYAPARAVHKMTVRPEEHPLAIQIFGADPSRMADAARMAQDAGADVVDINMGCWVPKVCKQGAGAALLKDPDVAQSIVRAVAEAVTVPVTVKVRAGWDYSLFAAPELAHRFQDVGAKMITLHARFAKQGHDGEADWDLIKRMREHVSVPLIGNGDVKTPDDALRMVRETGCDGVMVGRAAISDPWRLRWIREGLDAGVAGPFVPPSMAERIAVALEHLRLSIDHEGDEGRAVRSLRGQIPLYIKGEPGAAQARERLTRLSSYHDVAEELGCFAAAAR